MMWYRKVGFYSNPFSIKPAAFHDEIIGQNFRKIMDKVDDGGFVFVKGDYGTGKTSVLKRIINRYRGKGKLIYINLEFLDEVKVKELLKKRAGFLQKITGALPRDTILLIDEAQFIKTNTSEDIYPFFDEGFIKSVVFVGTNLNKKSFSANVEKNLRGNIVSLKTLTIQDAVKLVRKRIGSVLLSDKIIAEIFSHSKNPRIFLENCEDVCKYAVDAYSNEADSEHVKAVLGKKHGKEGSKKRKKMRAEKGAMKEAMKENVGMKGKPEKRQKKNKKGKEGKKGKNDDEKLKREKPENREEPESKNESEMNEVKKEEGKREDKEKEGKESKKGVGDKEIEFYIDTDGYPEYTFKQEF